MLSVASYQDQIAQIAVDVFQSMLRMEVTVGAAPKYLAGDVAAIVRFEGSWDGALLIQCSLDQAFEFASRLMGIDRPGSFDEDARDALGEIANMIGGNLKPLLPPGIALSVPEMFPVTPTVAERLKDECQSPITLGSEAGSFSVVLLEHSFIAGESGRCIEEKINA